MNDIIKVAVNLMLICSVAGVILAGTWAQTEPVKLREEKKELELALKELIPSAGSIKEAKSVVIAGKEGKIYKAETDGKVVGYIVLSYGKGYSSFIKELVAVDPEYKVIAVQILDQKETPGLGDQVDTDAFKAQFKGKSADHLVVIKGETATDIQALTGATISSRAATKGVKDAVETLKSEVEKGL